MTVRRSLVVVLHDDAGHLGYGESPAVRAAVLLRGDAGLRAAAAASRCSFPGSSAGRWKGPEAVDALLQRGRAGQPVRPRGARDRGLGSRGAPPRHRHRGAARRAARRHAVGPIDRVRRRARHPHRPVHRYPPAVDRGGADARLSPGQDQGRARLGRCAACGRRGVRSPAPASRSRWTPTAAYEWPEHESNLRALDEAGAAVHRAAARARRAASATSDCRRRSGRRSAWTRRCTTPAPRGRSLELDGPRVWNVKVHRMGGLTEVCRVVRIARACGVRLWAGTMPESGLGSQAALAVAAPSRTSSTPPTSSRAPGGSAGADVIELRMSSDGTMPVPASAIAERLDQALFRRRSRRLH